MVMEAPPSPQCVGREFVRQYYTLLNQAPTHLHRFYNNQSSFVHGGLDAPNRETSPMIGQKQIHQKIQQLNFRDCHAKITQVDSQATLGDGVVVQVTGELSNAGQPMRRFTQTFVLGAQSPKKYYVHNDIFRYQDEVFTDEECDQESGRSEPEDEIVPEPAVQEALQPIPQQPMAYYAANTVTNAPIQPPAIQVPHHPPQLPPVITPANVATVNGSVHPEDVLIPQQAQQQPVQPTPLTVPAVASATVLGLPNQVPPALSPPIVEDTPVQPVSIVDPEPIEEPDVAIVEDTVEEEKTPEPEPVEEPAVQEPVTPVLNEPKTYANLVKSGGGASPMSFSMSAMSTSPSQPSKTTASSPPPASSRSETREQTPMSSSSIGTGSSAVLGQRGPPRRGAGAVRGMPRQDSSRSGPGRNSFNEDGDDRRRSSGPGGVGSQYGDNHQLFLGNLPHHATEDDLREVFSQFGAIVDLRIHSKPGGKGMVGSTRVPNYGFITFEDQAAVQSCLQARPLYFPPNCETSQKLNVEEKKTRPRTAMDGGVRMGPGGQDAGVSGGRPGNGPGPRTGSGGGGGGGPGMMRNNGPPRGRGGFNRSDGRNSGAVNRSGNSYNNRR